MAEQLVVIAAATIVYASTAPSGSAWAAKLTKIALWVFGLSTINFGLAQFTGIAETASMVPKWIPLGGDFWAIFTGFAFVVAGVGILCGFLDLLAARLLTLMMLIFSALALAPLIVAYPHSHIAWGSNAYNLAVVGAAWILADWLAGRRCGPGLHARP